MEVSKYALFDSTAARVLNSESMVSGLDKPISIRCEINVGSKEGELASNARDL